MQRTCIRQSRLIFSIFLESEVASGRNTSRNECGHVIHKGFDLRRGKILAVGGHVSPTLHDLAGELRTRESHADIAQVGPTLAAKAINGVAVAALLILKDDRPLELKWRTMENLRVRSGLSRPSIHHR